MIRVSFILIGLLLTFSTIKSDGIEINEFYDQNGQKSYVLHFNGQYATYPAINGNNLKIEDWANRVDSSIPRQEWENLQFWDNYDKLNQFRQQLVNQPDSLKELLSGDKQAALNQLLNNPHDGFDLNAFIQNYINDNNNFEDKTNQERNFNENKAENTEQKNIGYVPPENREKLNQINNPNTENINQNNENKENLNKNTNTNENINQNTNLERDERKFLNYRDPQYINNTENETQRDYTPLPHEDDKSWIDIAKEKFKHWTDFGKEFPGEEKDKFTEYYFYNQAFLNKYPNEPQLNESDFNTYLERIKAKLPAGFIEKTKEVFNNAKDTVKEYAGKIKDFAVDKFNNITGSSAEETNKTNAPTIEDLRNKNPTQEELEANKRIENIDFAKNAEVGRQYNQNNENLNYQNKENFNNNQNNENLNNNQNIDYRLENYRNYDTKHNIPSNPNETPIKPHDTIYQGKPSQ